MCARARSPSGPPVSLRLPAVLMLETLVLIGVLLLLMLVVVSFDAPLQPRLASTANDRMGLRRGGGL